ncbi:MAG TPA: hypothetical protein VNO81_03595 [Candidatus Nitrosotenuis sp.]|nr:hypothetical protein [Candidatus Nitrosotenuis sp.]
MLRATTTRPAAPRPLRSIPSEIGTPDGSRIHIEVDRDASLTTLEPVPFPARFQVYEPGQSRPRLDIASSRAFIHASNGMLQVCGRGQDGRRYRLHARFPQTGVESFDFSHPVYAGVEEERFGRPDQVVIESHPGVLEEIGEVGSRSWLRKLGKGAALAIPLASASSLMLTGWPLLGLVCVAAAGPLLIAADALL